MGSEPSPLGGRRSKRKDVLSDLDEVLPTSQSTKKNAQAGPSRPSRHGLEEDDDDDVIFMEPDQTPPRNRGHCTQGGAKECAEDHLLASARSYPTGPRGAPANRPTVLFNLNEIKGEIVATIKEVLGEFREFNAGGKGPYVTPPCRKKARCKLSMQQDEDRHNGLRLSYLVHVVQLMPGIKLTPLQRIARLIIQQTLKIEVDEDILLHNTVLEETADDFAEGLHVGPNLENLQLDLTDNNSPWSATVVELLKNMFQATMTSFEDIPERDDAYVSDLFRERLCHIKDVWDVSLPKINADSNVKGPPEVEKRYVKTGEVVGSKKRRTGRTCRVSFGELASQVRQADGRLEIRPADGGLGCDGSVCGRSGSRGHYLMEVPSEPGMQPWL
jgi:hypothetical protein